MYANLHRQRGAVAIMVALSLVLLLAVVGLVVDSGMAYMVKARLNAAVDSAALAGARAVTTGNNQDEQRKSAQDAAAQFFAANLPKGYLLSKPQLTSTTVTFEGGQATIDVRAQAPMPVSLMQVLGFTSLSPTAYAQTIRRDLDMAFVVDTSGSLLTSGTAVKSAATTFLNKFNVTQDRVSLIHFSTGAVVDNPINPVARGFDRPSMLANINSYAFVGGTSSVEGMWHARDQLKKVVATNRSALRVIVFFSDGEPTSFASYFNFSSDKYAYEKCPHAGSIYVDSTGLYRTDKADWSSISTACTISYSNYPVKMPAWYNAHNGTASAADDPAMREFPIVTKTPREVTSEFIEPNARYRNLDRASRNLPEAVAAKAREEGIFVFTLGMGADLRVPSGYDNEIGENILKCMANVADGPSRCYDPAKPVGMYCYAATTAELTPCFSRLASAILRISK